MNEKNSNTEIIAMIKEMDNQIGMMKNIIEADLAGYNLPFSVLDALLPISIQSLEDEQTVNWAFDMLVKFSTDNGACINEKLSEYSKENGTVINKDEPFVSKKAFVLSIKDAAKCYHTMVNDAKEMRKEANEILEDYQNYLSSPEVERRKEERLKLLREQVEKEKDSYAKSQMMKMIHTMEQTKTFEFLLERFTSNKEKEVKSVEDQFFHERKGTYIIKRFKDKMPKFGFGAELYRYFFNLEERFLDKEYHVYNNLFLFVYMRYVAHADISSSHEKIYVQALTSAIANLIYHKYNKPEDEEAFKSLMMTILDNFKEDVDVFNEKNTTHPNHPMRIEADRKHETKRKEALIKKMDEIGITGYDVNSSANDMQKYFNDQMDILLEKEIKETGKQTEVKEEDDGTTTIAPKSVDGDDAKEPVVAKVTVPGCNISGVPMMPPDVVDENNCVVCSVEELSEYVRINHLENTVQKDEDGREYVMYNNRRAYLPTPIVPKLPHPSVTTHIYDNSNVITPSEEEFTKTAGNCPGKYVIKEDDNGNKKVGWVAGNQPNPYA